MLATEITEGTEKIMNDELTEEIIGAAIEVHRILELKAVTKLPEVATAQTLSNLKSTGFKRALLINFSQSRLVDGIKRLSP